MAATDSVHHAFLVREGGLLLASRDLSTRPAVDEDVFSAALEAIQHFMRVTFPVFEGRPLRTLGYEDFRILIERGERCCLVLVVQGTTSAAWWERMREALARFEKENATALRRDADDRLVERAHEALHTFFSR